MSHLFFGMPIRYLMESSQVSKNVLPEQFVLFGSRDLDEAEMIKQLDQVVHGHPIYLHLDPTSFSDTPLPGYSITAL